MNESLLDLRLVPTGVVFRFLYLFYVATLTAIFLVYLFASSAVALNRFEALNVSLLCAPLLWAVTLLFVGATELAVRRFTRLRPPKSADEQRAAGRVQAVAAELGIAPPLVLVAPTYKGRNAWVQGLRAPYFLVIEAGFTGKARRDPPLFDAAVAHELAHVANGDARRLAVSVALAAVLRWLIILTVGIPVAGFVMQVASDVFRINLAIPQNQRWLSESTASLLFLHIVPAIIAYLPFRLGYAHLMRQREFAADWLASISGRSFALAKLLLPHHLPRRLGARLGDLFDIRANIAERLHYLRHPEQLNAAPWTDYLWIGVGSGLTAAALDDLNFLNMFGPDLPDRSTLVEKFAGNILPLIAEHPDLLILMPIAFCGVILSYASLPALATTGMLTDWRLPWLGKTIAQALLMFLGSILGRVAWTGNVRDYAQPSATFTVFQAAMLNDRNALTASGIFVLTNFMVLMGTRLISRWWMCGRGQRPGKAAWLSIATLVGGYFTANAVSTPLFLFLLNVTSDEAITGSLGALLPFLLVFCVIRLAVGGREIAVPIWLSLPRSICGPPILPDMVPTLPPVPVWPRHISPLRKQLTLLQLVPLATLLCLLSAVTQVYTTWFLIIAVTPEAPALADAARTIEMQAVTSLRNAPGLNESYRPPLLINGVSVLDNRIEGILGRAVDPVVRRVAEVFDTPSGYRVGIAVSGSEVQPSATVTITTVGGGLLVLPPITGSVEAVVAGVIEGVLTHCFPIASALRLRPTDPKAALRVLDHISDFSRIPREVLIRAYNLGSVLLMEGGDSENAILVARVATRLAPDFPTAWRNLGDAQAKMELYDDAIRSYRRGLSFLQNDSPLWNQLGIALEKRDRVESAIQAYRNSVASDIHHMNAQGNLAVLLINSNRVVSGNADHTDICAMLRLTESIPTTSADFTQQRDSIAAWLRDNHPCSGSLNLQSGQKD